MLRAIGFVIFKLMNWKKYIHSDPNVLMGKSVVKGTRLSIDFILRLFGQGWSEQQVLENYPTLTPEALKAVFTFSAECMSEEALYFTSKEVKSAASGQ